MPSRRLAPALLFACACARAHPEKNATPPTATAAAPLVIPADAELSPSGLGYRVERIGTTGEPARATDRVVVRYTMCDAQGKQLRATHDRDTETIELSALPPGWAEGMQLLRAGDRAKLWVPESLAYPAETNGPDGPLVIEVELVDVLRSGGKAVPSSTAPADAQRTASGIAYVVLHPGNGTAHPGPGAKITAHYVGWTASDLQQFDSSYERREPIEFQAEHVIKGWGEATALMVVGETTRFWIPEALAYEGKPNLPAGTLIFDIELLGFTPAR